MAAESRNGRRKRLRREAAAMRIAVRTAIKMIESADRQYAMLMAEYNNLSKMYLQVCQENHDLRLPKLIHEPTPGLIFPEYGNGSSH